jgi:hypothetical protein
VLLGPLPNVYLYAANNPSESIVAKRRGYGTIVSHNVPPYGRAGACSAAVVQLLVRDCSAVLLRMLHVVIADADAQHGVYRSLDEACCAPAFRARRALQAALHPA